MGLLDLDARWRRLNDADRACPCCGRTFGGVFDIGFDHPDAWPHGALEDHGGPELAAGSDRLSGDLCRLDDRRFLRGVLLLPLRGADERVAFGLWTEVAAEDFYRYLHAALGEGPVFAGCDGRLANAFPGIDAGAEPCAVVPGGPGERPHLRAMEGPLAAAAAKGLAFDTLLDVYAAAGHDIRPHLAVD